jgi:hypothetical protein
MAPNPAVSDPTRPNLRKPPSIPPDSQPARRSALGAPPSSPLTQFADGYDSFFSSSSQTSRQRLTGQKSFPELREQISAFQSRYESPAFNPDSFPASGYDKFFTSTPVRPTIIPPVRSTPSSASSPAVPATPHWHDQEFHSFDSPSDTLVASSSFFSPEPPPKYEIPTLPRVSEAEKIDIVLNMLRTARISATDVLLATLSKPTYAAPFYSDPGPMTKLLSTMYKHERGQHVLNSWLEPHALDLVCNRISAQADQMVKEFSTHKSVGELTPEFLRSWSLKETIAKPADLHAPDLLRILRCAMNNPKALAKNKKKSNETVLDFDRIYPSFDYFVGVLHDPGTNCYSQIAVRTGFRRTDVTHVVGQRLLTRSN